MISVSFSKMDHSRDSKTTLSKSFFVTPSQIVASGLAHESSDIQASAVSPSGDRKAILRQTSGGKPQRYVEIWVGDLMEVSKDVTSTHGPFCTEGKCRLISPTRQIGFMVYFRASTVTFLLTL